MSFKALLVCVPLIATVALSGCTRARATAADFTAAGDRYAHDGRYTAAAIEYRNAIQREPRFATAHARLATTLEVMGRIDEAYREYANAISLDPGDVRSHLAAGRLSSVLKARPNLVAQQDLDEGTGRDRVAEARDQARVIGFLASSDADFVTGVTIDVTGGI